MQKLRTIHLYLGCVFAPLLLFFAVSGVWQTLGFHSQALDRLSTIHTSHQLKTNDSLSGLALMLFVLIMALSFIATTILGIVLAIKHSRSKRVTYFCLAIGVIIPCAFVLLRAFGFKI